MADLHKRLPNNAEGDFFVDSTCIDCDTCRQLAPRVFVEAGDYSIVGTQPESEQDVRAALQSLIACPTGSIGTRTKHSLAEARNDFPILLDDEVYYCGYASPKSYGGSSYFVRHPEGNWLVDSPKYIPQLADSFERLGGIQHIFLTHRDDVADAARYADRFGAERIIHRFEQHAMPGAERILEGFEPIALTAEFLSIPTPGHTRGHIALLYHDILFSGDHMWWNVKRRSLSASRSVCWYSWSEQVESLERLLDYDFAWVMPGHGARVHLPKEEMKREMERLIERCSGSGARDPYAASTPSLRG